MSKYTRAVDAYDWEGAADALEAEMRDAYPDLFALAYEDASLVLDLPELSFDVTNPRIKDVIDTLATKVRNVTDTTRDEIRHWVDVGTEQGLSAKEIARHIKIQGTKNAERRAMVIARSETASAYVKGSILAWQQSGVVARKQWLLGPKPCSDCMALADQEVDLDGEFEGGIDGPPRHPDCVCAILPVLGARS